MWTNIRSIANEAIEAAIDIKQHITEVTSIDLDQPNETEINTHEVNEKYDEDYIDKIYHELYICKQQYKDLFDIYQSEKNN